MEYSVVEAENYTGCTESAQKITLEKEAFQGELLILDGKHYLIENIDYGDVVAVLLVTEMIVNVAK